MVSPRPQGSDVSLAETILTKLSHDSCFYTSHTYLSLCDALGGNLNHHVFCTRVINNQNVPIKKSHGVSQADHAVLRRVPSAAA